MTTASLLALLLSSAHAAPAADSAVSNEAAATALYRELHASPELSYQEEKTSARLAKELRDAGYEVLEGFGRYDEAARVPHGVVGVLKNGPGKTLLLRTDMDGLPVLEKTGLPFASSVKAKNDKGELVSVTHACGHDLHMAVWAGTARALAQAKDRWSGTLILIGQPAEEVGAGARSLLEGGLYQRFPRPDFALALHGSPLFEAGHIGWREGFVLANVDRVEVTVRGKGGHGGYPQASKDPVVLAAQMVLAFQTIISRENSPTEPAVLTVGSIHGGTKYNIIPDEVKLEATVRSFTPQARERILAAMRRIARGLAEAAGLPESLYPVVKVDEKYTPAAYNDPALARRVAEAMSKSLGAERVEAAEPVMFGEDFARYALLPERKIPIAIFWLGAADPAKLKAAKARGEELPSLHSPLYAPLAEPAIRTGIQAITAAALDLLAKP
ncbi:MAG TPA: amidohydrolase [Elusimicrobiota bacterium]|jgi:hippurate hydrolase|nr:amidohydrolase [Elusimicrobiota bacterium]